MNKKQKVVMWIGVVVALFVFVFPPVYYEEGSFFAITHRAIITRTIFSIYPLIDYRLLLTVWLMITVVTVAAIVTLADKKTR